MTESRIAKSRQRELDEILSLYGGILNRDGADSEAEIAFLKKYAGDEEVLKLLRGARAVKTLFEAFGDFPDLGPSGEGRAWRGRAKG